MKLLPMILINLLVTGTGLIVYDQMRGDAPAAQDQGGTELALQPDLETEPEREVVQAELIGSGSSAIFADLRKQEKELSQLRSLVAKLTKASGGGTIAIEGGSEGAMPALDLPEIPEDPEPSDFDERTISSLRKHMEEIDRQRREERVLEGINRQLERLGVSLADDQKEAVVEATVAHRNKIRDVWRGARGLDEEGRAALREQMSTVQEEYKTTLYSLVPSGDADKIVEGMSGSGRTFGGTGGGRQRGQRGGGGGR